MTYLLPTEAAKQDFNIQKVFRAEALLSVYDLEPINVYSLFIHESALTEEQFVKSEHKNESNFNSIETFYYYTLNELLDDLKLRMNEKFDIVLKQTEDTLNEFNFFSKFSNDYKFFKKQKETLLINKDKFNATDISEFINISSFSHLILDMEPFALNFSFFKVKQSPWKLDFEIVQLDHLKVFNGGGHHNLIYVFKDGDKEYEFELHPKNIVGNRIRTGTTGITLYLDEQTAINDYNAIINDFNQKHPKLNYNN